MAAFLPNGQKAEVVAENLDERLSVNWSQTRQGADQESALWRNRRYLPGCLFSENRQVQIKRFFEVLLSLSQGPAYRIHTKR